MKDILSPLPELKQPLGPTLWIQGSMTSVEHKQYFYFYHSFWSLTSDYACYKINGLYKFARVAITKYHSACDLKAEIYFLRVLEAKSLR